MGQYFKLINETKKEQITSWKFGGGAKFFDWRYNNQAQILVWLFRQSDGGGGGDIPETERYQTLGRWAGDKITLIGDYDSSKLWDKTKNWQDIAKLAKEEYNSAVKQG